MIEILLGCTSLIKLSWPFSLHCCTKSLMNNNMVWEIQCLGNEVPATIEIPNTKKLSREKMLHFISCTKNLLLNILASVHFLQEDGLPEMLSKRHMKYMGSSSNFWNSDNNNHSITIQKQILLRVRTYLLSIGLLC